MRRMPFRPFPLCVVCIYKFVKHHPQVLVLNGLFVRTPPSVPFPSLDPLHDAVFYILRIRNDFDGTPFIQPFQTFNHSGKFHAVISRVSARSEQLAFKFAIPENASPASLSGIALAGSVRDQLNVLQATSAHSGAESPCS